MAKKPLVISLRKPESIQMSAAQAMKAYLDATGHDRRPLDPRVMERINTR